MKILQEAKEILKDSKIKEDISEVSAKNMMDWVREVCKYIPTRCVFDFSIDPDGEVSITQRNSKSILNVAFSKDEIDKRTYGYCGETEECNGNFRGDSSVVSMLIFSIEWESKSIKGGDL